MKFVKTTYVDIVTQVPIHLSPASNGIILPPSHTILFALEDSVSTGIPIIFCRTEHPTSWEEEISETDLLHYLKNELLQRISKKALRCLDSVEGFTISNALLSTLYELKECHADVVFFESNGKCYKFSKEEVSQLYTNLLTKQQSVLGWKWNKEQEIQKVNVEEGLKMLKELDYECID